MARRPRGPEKIYMDEKRFGYFPQRFTWRGQSYDVHAVERCWTVSRKRLGNRVDRLCFRVRCVAGVQASPSGVCTFHLHQNLRTNTWHMEKIISLS
jgi:hypothetical protein